MIKRRNVVVAKGLSMVDGRKQVLRTVLRKHGGDYRAIGYDPKTGKGWAL